MASDTPTVALTGGVASGKSTVAAEFAKLGIPVIDTDKIAREIIEPGQPAFRSVVEYFGKQILDESGRVNRAWLREMIFNDPVKKQKLESILHPAIRSEQQRRASQAGGAYQLHVIPLLAETATQKLYDRVLLVDCPVEVQLQRLITRDGIATELAERMIAAQATREQRLTIADDVIDNSADQTSLRTTVAGLHQSYLKHLAHRA